MQLLQTLKIYRDPEIPDPDFKEDPDVEEEKERVKSGAANNDVIVVNGMRKVYSGPKVNLKTIKKFKSFCTFFFLFFGNCYLSFKSFDDNRLQSEVCILAFLKENVLDF